MDIILDWNRNTTALFVNEHYEMTTEFYHGIDRNHIANEKLPEYSGMDSIMLYTLSPGFDS